MNAPGSLNWLVSCRSVSEAKLAARHGVPIIDFKEPGRGALEATPVSVWRRATDVVPMQWPGACLSAALGESPDSTCLAAELPNHFRFAKAGPSGLASLDAIQAHWRGLRGRLPRSVELVAVAYADHSVAGCPAVEAIIAQASQDGLKYVLVDTFHKQGQSLIDLHSSNVIRGWIDSAIKSGLWISLAGSLQLKHCQQLVSDGAVPHCWGARGDVCVPSKTARRTGALDPERLRLWAAFIADEASTRSAPSSLQNC